MWSGELSRQQKWGRRSAECHRPTCTATLRRRRTALIEGTGGWRCCAVCLLLCCCCAACLRCCTGAKTPRQRRLSTLYSEQGPSTLPHCPANVAADSMQLPAQLHLRHAPNQRQLSACGTRHRSQRLCWMAAAYAAADTGRPLQLSFTQKMMWCASSCPPATMSSAPLGAEHIKEGHERLCTKQGAYMLGCPAAHLPMVQYHGQHEPRCQGQQVQVGPLQASWRCQQQCPAAGQGPAAVALAAAAAPCCRRSLLHGQQRAALPCGQSCRPCSLPWAASP